MAQGLSRGRHEEGDGRRPAGAAGERILEVFERITDAFFGLDRAWRFTYLNPQAERLLSRSCEGLVGKNVWDEFPEAKGSTFQREYERAARTGEAVSFEEHFPPLESWFEVNAYPSEGGLSVYFRDVTARKRAEEERERMREALLESERRLRAVLSRYSSDVVMFLDSDGVIRHQSPAVERVLGYEPEALVGEEAFGYIHPDDQERTAATFSEVLAKPGPHGPVEYRFRHQDGSWRWMEALGNNLLSDPGVRAIVVNSRDVTGRKGAEAALKRSEALNRAVVDTAPDAILTMTPDGIVRSFNRGAQEMFGYAAGEVVGRPLRTLMPERFREAHERGFRRYLETGEARVVGKGPVGLAGLRKDGEEFPMELSLGEVGEGEDRLFTGIVRDITERKAAEEALKESEERFRGAFEDASVGVALVGLDNRYLRVNRAFCEMLGYTEGELVGRNSFEITHPDDRKKSRDRTELLVGGESRTMGLEKRYVRKDGSILWALSDVSLVRGAGGEPVHFVGQYQDITERKRLEEELEHRAFHDPTTGLPNRALFMDRLGHALSRMRGRRNNKIAVLFMDLDNFKYVNDTLGHQAGDELLAAVAGRLRRCLRPADTAARLGGDEFAALLEDVKGASGATRVAERIVEELGTPFVLGGQEVYVTPSIGICAAQSGREAPEDLVRNADVAMYRAKEEGKARHRVFDPSMEEGVRERLRLENDLRRAIERDEFEVYYQPVVALDTGRIVGMEALVRWEHPERGLLSPSGFVPLAEEIGLIVPIGRKVLEEACRQTKAWQELYPSTPPAPPLIVGVNLSARQIRHPGLIGDVEGALRESGLDPGRLILEVTESAMVGDGERHTDALRRLRDLGVRLALDDFGTGYSSLSYLRRLPVGMVKIDRSFVQGIGEDGADDVLLEGVVGIAHALGLRVCAEGVETPEQLERVRDLGCDLVQGYYFSEPLPAKAADLAVERGLSPSSDEE